VVLYEIPGKDKHKFEGAVESEAWDLFGVQLCVRDQVKGIEINWSPMNQVGRALYA
jgi:hypothetical protein